MMKLIDWAITDALKEGDYLAAVNMVCALFQLPPFRENSPAIEDMKVLASRFHPQEISIFLDGTRYVWESGRTTTTRSSITAPWITMWVAD
jgi:hypothetical protein